MTDSTTISAGGDSVTVSGRSLQRAALEAQSVGKEQVSVFEAYEHEDLTGLQEQLSGLYIELERLKDEAKEAAKEHKAGIDAVQVRLTEVAQSVRQRGREVTRTCYLVPNEETRMMEYIDEDGQVVKSRRLTLEERQKTIPLYPQS